MHADFSVELGHDDPVLEIPWASDDHSVRYYDLKTNPDLVLQIPEAAAHPEIKAFLSRINSPGSPFETAKCDVWESRDITPEEEIFGADRKFVSYVDLIFVDETIHSSFEKHEEFARSLCLLLDRAPDIAATIELVIRRCYYHQRQTDRQGKSGRIGKDQQQATTDQQDISLRQEISKNHGGQQYPSEKNRMPPDHVEMASGLKTPGELDSETSFKSANSHDSGASPKSERPQEPKAQVNPHDPASLGQHGTREMNRLHPANIFLPNPKAFLNESIPPLNEWGAGFTGFYFTAYVTGFGDSDHPSRSRWTIAISLLQYALVQSGNIRNVLDLGN